MLVLDVITVLTIWVNGTPSGDVALTWAGFHHKTLPSNLCQGVIASWHYHLITYITFIEGYDIHGNTNVVFPNDPIWGSNPPWDNTVLPSLIHFYMKYGHHQTIMHETGMVHHFFHSYIVWFCNCTLGQFSFNFPHWFVNWGMTPTPHIIPYHNAIIHWNGRLCLKFFQEAPL